MSDIQILASEVKQLEIGVARLSVWVLVLLAVTALAGVVSFVLATAAHRKNIHLGNKRAALIRAKDEQMNAALSGLDERTAPRTISPDQRVALVAALKQGPKGVVHVVSVWGDTEGFAYAGQIAEILRESGWSRVEMLESKFNTKNPVDVSIRVRDRSTAPPYAFAIPKAFESVGVPLPSMQDPKMAEGYAQIVVGTKP